MREIIEVFGLSETFWDNFVQDVRTIIDELRLIDVDPLVVCEWVS